MATGEIPRGGATKDTTMEHPAGAADERLRAECDVQFQRRSGPGGQHRNKVETAVRLTHRPTGMVAQASERRSQADNLRVAYRRLRIELALNVRLPWQDPDPRWLARLVGKRMVVSTDHADFPALLAECLDCLAVHAYHLPTTAAALHCSPSQLGRFLQKEPRAWQRLNHARKELGLPPLRGPD